MQIPTKFKGRYFYHFTHLSNIESIVKEGILSTNEKQKRKINHTDLANENIQMRRSNMDVPCKPYGKIHDYVPFYFASTNPMLLSVLNRKNIDQPLVVFIAISIDKLLNDNVIFTNASANTTIAPEFFDNPEDLEKLNWELIDSKKWGTSNKDELHARMAEVLIYNKVPIEYIDTFYVYNDYAKEEIKEIYKRNNINMPKISYEAYDKKFFYTKFFFSDRKNQSLITGPIFLKNYFLDLQNKVIEKRLRKGNPQGAFNNIDDALVKIKSDFCVIKELKGIYELQASNKVHNDNVSEHTIKVVNNIRNNEYYNRLSEHDRKLVELSAYFHDIGKGPKEKWKDGIQQVYADHPADAIPMLERILVEEFNVLSEYEIRKVSLLVTYHDIIGDILKDDIGRSKKELYELEIDQNELNMLICLGLGDISSINIMWQFSIKMKLPSFEKEVHKEMRF